MNCKDCKYWVSLEDDSSASKLGLRECTKVKMFWDSTEWASKMNTDDTERSFKRNITTKAFVRDGSDYSAQLFTLADFGCNQFEQKEQEKKV